LYIYSRFAHFVSRETIFSSPFNTSYVLLFFILLSLLYILL